MWKSLLIILLIKYVIAYLKWILNELHKTWSLPIINNINKI
jgi:hypothetical protein